MAPGYYPLPCNGILCSKQVHERKRARRSTHCMFAKERYSESKLHVERSYGLPTLCLECAKSEFHNDVSGQFVGILTAVESMKYARACALDALANKFCDDGLAVVKSDQSAIMAIDLMQSFIKGEPIAHLANSMQLNALKAHDGRKWKNIYPCKKPFDSKQNTRIALIVKPFTTFLEMRFFPHDFYARMARQMVAVLESDKNDLLKLNRQEGDTLLCLKTINGLVRGASLNKRQNLHIDGYEVGLTDNFLRARKVIHSQSYLPITWVAHLAFIQCFII